MTAWAFRQALYHTNVGQGPTSDKLSDWTTRSRAGAKHQEDFALLHIGGDAHNGVDLLLPCHWAVLVLADALGDGEAVEPNVALDIQHMGIVENKWPGKLKPFWVLGANNAYIHDHNFIVTAIERSRTALNAALELVRPR